MKLSGETVLFMWLGPSQNSLTVQKKGKKRNGLKGAIRYHGPYIYFLGSSKRSMNLILFWGELV